MLNIIMKPNNQMIKDVEAYFNTVIDKSVFSKGVYAKIIKEIDKSEFIYPNSDVVKTPFGVTTLDNLSTGCKTVLLLVYTAKQKIYVPLVECGLNALICALDIGKNMDLYAYMPYPFVVPKGDYSCSVDGKVVSSSSDIYNALKDGA